MEADERPTTELYDALLERDDTAVSALNAATDSYPKLLAALEAIDKHSEREDIPDGEVIALIQGELDIVLSDAQAALLEALNG